MNEISLYNQFDNTKIIICYINFFMYVIKYSLSEC